MFEASPERVAPPCPYAHPGGCGGCDLQHASPSGQVAWKTSLVAEHLRRIAGVDVAFSVVEPPSDAKGSRTRLRCAVDEDGRPRLRAARSHDLVTIDACWIADDALSPAFATSWDGAEEVELRAIGDGEPFAVVRRDTHRGTMYELCSLRGEPLEPSTQSRVDVRGHVFSVGPRSFWQSHRDAPTMLLDAVLDFADVSARTTTSPTSSAASDSSRCRSPRSSVPGGRVTAVESSPYAVRDARQNAEGLRNVKVREWSVTPTSDQ